MLNRSTIASAIVLACLLAATLVSSPWASDETPQSSPTAKLLPKGQAKDAVEKLLRRSGAVLNPAADPVVDYLTGEPSRKVKLKPFIYSSAVDGDLLVYARSARTLTNKQISDSLGAFPTLVVRKNLRTGVEDVLLRSNSTAVGSIIVKGGAISLSTSKLSAGRRSVVFETSVLHAAPGANELQVLATHSGRLTVGRDSIRVCGTISGLTGASDSGNPFVSTLSGKCDALGFLTTETREILGLDSSVPLDVASELLLFIDEPADVVGDRTLMTSRFSSAFGVANIRTGQFTDLWQGSATAAALADDGTVAIIDEFDDEYFDDFSHETAPTRPIVIFPQGNADNPVEIPIVEDGSDISSFKFCGPNLYVIKRLKLTAKQRRAANEYYEAEPEFGAGIVANYNVFAYDRAGAFVKEFGKTPGMKLGEVGCSGDALVAIAERGVKTTELRFQP